MVNKLVCRSRARACNCAAVALIIVYLIGKIAVEYFEKDIRMTVSEKPYIVGSVVVRRARRVFARRTEYQNNVVNAALLRAVQLNYLLIIYLFERKIALFAEPCT